MLYPQGFFKRFCAYLLASWLRPRAHVNTTAPANVNPGENAWLWLLLGEIRAVPPAASQRLEESRGVGIAIGLGLNEVYQGLLVGLFRG